MQFDVYLASASPRRQALLRQLGVAFAVQVPDVDERPRPAEDAADFVQRLAREKAGTIWTGLDEAQRRPVLGADTVVVVDGKILGKPRDPAQAVAMLNMLSGRTHQVLTGVALVAQRRSVCVNVSEVRFRRLTQTEIDRYWATGEPAGKAGAYAIQGFAAAFIEQLQGSYSGVMGLPLYETAGLLQAFDIPIWHKHTYE